MIVLEYKCKGKPNQYKAIDEAIRTTQFIRNKAIRYWMDNSRELKIDRFALNKYSTTLRNQFPFVANLNSMAVQSAAERGWICVKRLNTNIKSYFFSGFGLNIGDINIQTKLCVISIGTTN
ncbi:hypothetical protein [Planktothrix agardhii]|uniref:hypothetical protein n=1 Tax=Planktothrix agardhii TaxID=1160 RepID=UPI003BB55E43